MDRFSRDSKEQHSYIASNHKTLDIADAHTLTWASAHISHSHNPVYHSNSVCCCRNNVLRMSLY